MGRPRLVDDDAILDAASSAIGAHGPAKLTLAHVAAEVGLSPAAIVQRFGSKHGLLVALATRSAAAVPDVFAAARRKGPLVSLGAAVKALLAGIGSPEVLANHIALLHQDLVDPQLRTLAVEHSRHLRRELERLLSEAVTTGELVDVDTGRLADAVFVAYNGSLIAWAIDGRGRLVPWVQRRIDAVLDPYRAD